MLTVDIIEGGEFLAVDIKDCQDARRVFRVEDGHDNLRTRKAATGDMTRKLLDIGHDKCFTPLPGRTTDTPSIRNMHTGHRALKRTKHQFLYVRTCLWCHPIESRPKKSHRLMDRADAQ